VIRFVDADGHEGLAEGAAAESVGDLGTPELFLLYQARPTAVTVPTRAFDADQLGEFRALRSRRTSRRNRPAPAES
jgi:hypothetical protein